MLYLGLILGCLVGLILAAWFAGRRAPLETFFFRFFQRENKSLRVDTRVMLHELHNKVEDLSSKMQRMDGQMQDLIRDATERKAARPDYEAAALQGNEAGNSFSRTLDVAALTKEGFSPEEIAERLDIARGEIDLILSLSKKPSWVVDRSGN